MISSALYFFRAILTPFSSDPIYQIGSAFGGHVNEKFDFEEAATKNGTLNQFELRRLKTNSEGVLNKPNALGTEVRNAFVLKFETQMPTADYDFQSKSFKLNIRKLMPNEMSDDVDYYKSDPILPSRYKCKASISVEFTNLPEKLAVNIGDDGIAEDWSRKKVILTVYFQVEAQQLQEKWADEANGGFEDYVRRKGYSSYSKVPKNNQIALQKSFMKEFPRSFVFTRVFGYTLKATVRFAQIELPDATVATWLTQKN